MMVLIFLLLLTALVLTFIGKRQVALYVLMAILMISCFWFSHYVTDHLGINL
jgi:hypothetical protein